MTNHVYKVARYFRRAGISVKNAVALAMREQRIRREDAEVIREIVTRRLMIAGGC